MKKTITFTLICIAMILVFTGCADKGTVFTVSGSTSVGPLMQLMADDYMDTNRNITIDIQGGGSSTGVKNASEGVSEIGMASRNLKEKEVSWGVTSYVIAVDGISVILNPNNPVTELTSQQITSIFKGEITNWSEVEGNDEIISVVSRESGSGTRGAFEELMDLINDSDASMVVETALISDSNGAVKAQVGSTKSAIGYMSMGLVDNSVIPIMVDGVKPTSGNAKNGSYPIKRNFLMITNGEVSKDVQAFIDYVLSPDGQKIVSEENYISIN